MSITIIETMRYFRNVDIVNEFGVNEATVRKWIRDAQSKKLDLLLVEERGRFYIADTTDNSAKIRELIDVRRKFRNSKATLTLRPEGFSGIWLTDYTYHNSDRDEDGVSQQYVRIYQRGKDLVVESIPDYNSAYMLARFSVDERIATGTWQQVTNAAGDYGGAIYHGAAQLVIAEDDKSMKGKWVGFGKNLEVKTGPWRFTYIGDDVSAIDKNKKLITQ